MSAIQADQHVATRGVIVVDSDRVIRHWDDGARRLFGYTIAEAEGRSLDLIDPDADRPWDTHLDGAGVLERQIKCNDGIVRSFAARLVSMKDPLDHTIGTALVFTDKPLAKVAEPERAVTDRGWFSALEGHMFVSLATRRRSGAIVPTTVWFAIDGGAVYVNTDQRSAKVKRIRNDPRVTLCPCTMRGTPRGNAIEGLAHIMPRAEQARVDSLLNAKYRWQRILFTALHRERITQYSELIEIVPPSG